MKKLKTLSLIILLILSSFNGMYAQQQQKTAYEKKLMEITEKYFKILYDYNQQLSMYDKAKLDMITDGEEAREFILGIGILSYAANHSETEVKRMVTQIENDLKQAEKLKTPIDFQREKERKTLATQAEYEKTDAGTIKKNIKATFELWNQKGEFEKQADYEERLQKQSQNAFTKTCIEQIKNKVRNYSDYYALSKELLPYNADNEFFIIKFKINGIEWQSKINIPIANAEKFKNNWSDLKFEINDFDWCFVENALCPTLITITESNSKYQITLPVQNQKEITYSFDDLGISNSYLKGFVFKYTDAKSIELKIVREKTIKDSIENQVFDTVEEMPEFPGGELELRNYIAKQIMYPNIAYENGIQGKIFVNFIVNKDGSISDAKITNSVHPLLDKEALRVVLTLPKWKPGKQSGVPVRVSYTAPVSFKLD